MTPATGASATLSVVLPVRDAHRYIGDALTSLTRNDRADFEFLVVDDGSTDGTCEVIDDFRAELPRMTVIRHDEAVGLADARNAGLDAAGGRYVTFMDGDDWLQPGYLPQLVDAIDGLGCDFVRVDHVQAIGRERSLHHAPQPRREVVLDPTAGIGQLHRSTMVDYPYAWAGVYRRGLGDLLRFPSGLRTAEDRPWIWRLHREAASHAVVSLAGLFYRRLVPDSLTQIGDARQLDFLPSFRLVFDLVRDEPALLPKAAKQFLVVVAHHLELGDRFEPALVDALRAGVRDLADTLPDGLVDQLRLDEYRQTLLDPVLGTAPTAGRHAGHDAVDAGRGLGPLPSRAGQPVR